MDDDSPDGTADLVRQLASKNPRVRIIHRIGRRGLASACVEGVLSSSTSNFAVIDADMQHDEQLLLLMLRRLQEEDLDLVVGSRYIDGGDVGEWSKRRALISRLAGRAARLVVKSNLKDPMSGFFIMRRTTFENVVRNLSQSGFKILLDLFASSPQPLRFAELPYRFRQREHGESKLDSIVPPRFVLFSAVGTLGLLLHMLILGIFFWAGAGLPASQTIAVLAAMTLNFTLNNLVTYRDRRLTGWRFLRGLLSFYAICFLGAVANVGVASLLYARQPTWWLAGLAGALVGAVWNYAVSSYLTWAKR